MIVYYKRNFYTTLIERSVFDGPYTINKKLLNLIYHLVKLGIMVKYFDNRSKPHFCIIKPLRRGYFLDKVSPFALSSNSVIF